MTIYFYFFFADKKPHSIINDHEHTQMMNIFNVIVVIII